MQPRRRSMAAAAAERLIPYGGGCEWDGASQAGMRRPGEAGEERRKRTGGEIEEDGTSAAAAAPPKRFSGPL